MSETTEVSVVKSVNEPELIKAARLSTTTWSTIVLLIVTISGYGYATYANSNYNDKQDVEIAKKLDKESADLRKENTDLQFQAVIQRLDDLKKEIEQIQDTQQKFLVANKADGGN